MEQPPPRSTHDSPPIPNPNPNPNPKQQQQQQQEVEQKNTLTFDSPHPIYAMSLSPSSIAIGSFLEELPNRVDVLSFSPQTSKNSPSLSPQLSFPHPYPPTKLMFHPLSLPLLASSSDSLRLWSLDPSPSLRSLLSPPHSSPLTSFDWNPSDPRRIATSSIDTTCTVWDLHTSSLDTQLIAHDKEVYDIAWGDSGVFASVSADGSLRVFDLRDKDHSAIVYECPRPDTPLLRLAWNRTDLRYMATLCMDGDQVIVLDIRAPAVPVAELRRHRGCVNALAWAPAGAGRYLCSGGDDGQALMWDLKGSVPGEGGDPVMAYQAGAEINQLQWSHAQPDWIGIAFANKLQLLKV